MNDTHCQKCNKPTEVHDSRWCASCHYPGIEDDYEEYLALIDEGYRSVDAAVMSGWKGAEEVFNDKAS